MPLLFTVSLQGSEMVGLGCAVPAPCQPYIAMPYVAQPKARTVLIDEQFEAKVQQIIDLGFERHVAMAALATCNNDEEAAIEHLL